MPPKTTERFKARSRITFAKPESRPSVTWWDQRPGETLEQWRARFNAEMAARQPLLSTSRFGTVDRMVTCEPVRRVMNPGKWSQPL